MTGLLNSWNIIHQVKIPLYRTWKVAYIFYNSAN